jgi:thioredoxin-like negative regulator of GroEL
MPSPVLPDNDSERASVQEAIEAFLAAHSEEEMEEVVADYPFVADPQFTAVLEQMIEHAGRAGQPEAMFRLQEQIATLEDVLRGQAATPTEKTVEAFLYAQDDEEAASIFAENADLLRSEEASRLLFSLEASDPESHLHLEARRQLWRRLTSANA